MGATEPHQLCQSCTKGAQTYLLSKSKENQGDTAYPGNEDTHPTAVGPTWPTNSRRNLRLVLPGWTIQDSCYRHECLHKLIHTPTINNFPASTVPTYAHQPVAAAVEQQPQSGWHPDCRAATACCQWRKTATAAQSSQYPSCALRQLQINDCNS